WREALLRGWLFGLAHFTLTNNWIATAFTYQAEMPAILGWAAVPLLSVYLAVYPALAVLGAHLIARGKSIPVWSLAFAGSWIVAEWLRSWVFTGYVWGPLSLMWVGPFARPGLALALPWFGTYALSGVVAFVSGLALWLIRQRRFALFGGAALVLALAMYLPQPAARPSDLAMTLVQPDLRQEVLDDPSNFETQFLTLHRLSQPNREFDRRLVLWPESAVPDYLRPGYPQRYYDRMTVAGDPLFARRRIGYAIGEDSLLLTGMVDLEIGEDEGYERAVGAYNAIAPIAADGTIGPRYAKAHLVPYGEYLPMRPLLEPLGLTRLVAGSIDFIPGPGPRTLDLGRWGKAGMQICYEIVFSGEVVDPDERPDYIFNPSNDGWFGAWGPPQHLGQARMRAIEEGLPVLRSTTTGISAVIDAKGVVRDHIGMRRADRIDAFVPQALEPTLFARMGHWLTALWAIAFLALSLVAARIWRR
ncbi:MAG: apolipoprotein N-acyltransferase, partial [Erythrobacter sp.]|nr:apolipoprotein N-acyltransferase [Erythrobacter sp.]